MIKSTSDTSIPLAITSVAKSNHILLSLNYFKVNSL